MSLEFRSECDDIEEAKSPSNTSVAAVAVKNADASVYKIIHGYLKQKNNSIIKVAANVARKAASNNMILLNKVVLSSYNFSAGISLMLYQNLISVIILLILELFGVISTEKLTWKLTKIVSAVCGGITDLSFHLIGYTWQILNCFLTAGYSLTLRRLMDTAKQSTKSGSLNEVSMVLLNNALSIPFAIVLIVIFNEWEYVIKRSGLLGLAISFSSVWFLHQTGPTTYSLVGSLNKIPISVAGILLFDVPVSVENLCSIGFGLFAGIFFAKAKMS
ncbi:hypothetical protein PR202_ga14017 [Eleusine coracana subsp. coracana]|uniref:Uncharacterized protein n=1 Tax=Eleusine coracana subsp. coracana TaxID=191504 RepID=A0AAV5CG78_ELECO|nr:hypothetical protein PR202_ga14017 [Eleusine coracana subsp. coracana]